jgi:hypothetical protein
MMKQIYVKGITPFKEVEVKPDSFEGKGIIIGFKVHGIKARKALAEKYEGNRADYIKLMTEVQKLEAIAKVKEAEGAELTEEEATKMQALIEDVYKEIDKLEETSLELTKADILYFKNVTATDYDDLGNEVFNLLVVDTRTVEPTEYWESPKECLEGFISVYTDAKVWLDAIKEAHANVMQEDFKALQVKN